jgi:hypothetical protein
MSRRASLHGGFYFCSPIFEIALVVVRCDYVASVIIDADHSMIRRVRLDPTRKLGRA